jgi:hypothetical protein
MAGPIISIAVDVTDSDPGFEELMDRLTDQASHVDIGIHPVSGEEMVIIAGVHEFGTSEAGANHDIDIPARPFIRSTVDENRGRYETQVQREWNAVLEGRRSIAQSLGLLGLMVETDIRRKIRSLKTPPNAQSTIDAKGSDNPLIDTGAMLNSVRYAVKDKKDGVLSMSDEGSANFEGGKRSKQK